MFPFPFSFLSGSAPGIPVQVDNVYSMSFDGTGNTFVDLGIISEINNLNNFSFSVWIKPKNPMGGVQGFVFGNRDSSNSFKGIAFSAITDSDPVFKDSQVYFEGNAIIIPKNTFAFDQWSHVVMTYDNASFKIYADSNVIANTSLANQSLTSTAAFNIGRDVGVGIQKDFNGEIDEVAIFNYALTSAEVLNIYNGTTTGKTRDLNDLTTPPIKWYRMGD